MMRDIIIKTQHDERRKTRNQLTKLQIKRMGLLTKTETDTKHRNQKTPQKRVVNDVNEVQQVNPESKSKQKEEDIDYKEEEKTCRPVCLN